MAEVHTFVEIESSLRSVLSKFRSILDHGAYRFISSEKDHPQASTRMQAFFKLKFINELDRMFHELIMVHAIAAEKLGPGGFNRCIELLLEYFSASKQGNHCSNNRTYDASPRVVSKNDIDNIIMMYADSAGDRTSSMVKRAIELAGFAGRIIVEKTTSTIPSVELVRGYTFSLQQFLPIDVSFVNPRIVCIDGYVESVSEVHHLLEAASSAKEPCVMFVRGMSEDVKHTLKVNYDRGSLKIIPIGVNFDLDGMNTLVDISVVTGGDLVSSLKGDLISKVKFEELARADQVTMFKGRVVVFKGSTHVSVKQHVAKLRLRRENEKIDDVAKLLDARIKSLSPNHVVIRLPDDKDFIISSQAIDYALRAVRSSIDHGVTPSGRPITTEIAARVHASRCCDTLRSLGASIC